MPRSKNTIPTYSRHKPSGQAIIRLTDREGGRKTVYLGPYGSPESRQEYARIVAELSAVPVEAPRSGERGDCRLTVNEILLAFWKYAEGHYRRADGTVTDELSQYRQTFRPLMVLYGRMAAAEFGPKALKVLRQVMIESGWTRKLINQRIGRVRRVFKWAASEELIPVSVYQSLTTVTGLQAGRSKAKETEPIRPVAEEDVRATLPFLRRGIRAMVQVQLLTGMRPGEVCALRPCDLDATNPIWLYRPLQFKTLHRDKSRVIVIGPKAQALLTRVAPNDPTGYYFCPRREVELLHAERNANRKTRRFKSHMTRNETKRVSRPQRRPSEKYTVTS